MHILLPVSYLTYDEKVKNFEDHVQHDLELSFISDRTIANLICWFYKPGLILEQVELSLEKG